MRKLSVSLFILLTVPLQWSVSSAQDPSGSDGPRAHEFWPVAPEVGDLFADISVVDDQGEPVSIRELASKENYSVLVLGCLT